MKISDKLRHFLKIDHIAFILILPSLFFNVWAAVVCWGIAFVYDLYEETK